MRVGRHNAANAIYTKMLFDLNFKTVGDFSGVDVLLLQTKISWISLLYDSYTMKTTFKPLKKNFLS